MRSDAGAGNERFPRDLLDIVRKLHDMPHRFTYTFAGVGSWTLALLHAVGGSSRSVLEATDAYHPSALSSSLAGSGLDTPHQSVSPEVASALATRSMERAHHLVRRDDDPGPTFGVGLTGTIATDRTKRGSHRFELAARDGLGTERMSVTLEKGARDRMGEEEHVARWVLHAMGRASGILGEPAPSQRETERLHQDFDPSDAFKAFLEGRRDVLHLNRDGEIVTHPSPVHAIVSGSFHPMHHGHLDLARSAEQHLGQPVAFEMAPTNAEKEPTSPLGIRIRASQAYGVRPLVLTRAPLFTDKVQHLPGTVFVVGVDTARRVLEPRFYGSEQERDEALDRIRQHGGRFLVAGRAGDDAFRTLTDLELPAVASDLFEELPGFRVDVSSTELRTSWHRSGRETTNSRTL